MGEKYEIKITFLDLTGKQDIYSPPELEIRRRQWNPTPVLLPRKSHGWRTLVGYSPWGCTESDMTERLHFYFSLSCIGEGNGNPLQCSCLENPRDGGAWWAAVCGVAQSWAWLNQLSSSSSSRTRDHLLKNCVVVQGQNSGSNGVQTNPTGVPGSHTHRSHPAASCLERVTALSLPREFCVHGADSLISGLPVLSQKPASWLCGPGPFLRVACVSVSRFCAHWAGFPRAPYQAS